MTRTEEILELVPEDSRELVKEVAEEAAYLETRLTELKQLPFIQVHPKQPALQRATPAAKQYKEFLQQYVNCIKVIEAVIYRDRRLEGEDKEESPLRSWFNAHSREKNLDA